MGSFDAPLPLLSVPSQVRLRFPGDAAGLKLGNQKEFQHCATVASTYVMMSINMSRYALHIMCVS
jgi:hypothetical protein